MLDPSASAGESPVLARADSDVSTSSSASSDSVFSSYTNSDRRSSTASSIHPHSSSGGKPGSGPSSSELDTPIAELPGELLHAGRSRSDTNDSATSITPGSSLNGLQQAIRSLAITPSLSQSESAQNHAKSYATPSAIMKSVTPGTVGKQHKTASTGDGFPWNRASSSKGGNISGRRGSRTVQDDSSIVSTPSAIFNSGYSDFPTPSSSKVQTSPTRRSDDVKGYRATAKNIEQHEEYFHQQQQQSDSSCSVDPYSSLRSTPLGKSASAGPSSPRTQSSSSSSANYKDSISAYHQQQQQQLSMAAVATISSISNNNFNPFRYSPPALAAPGGSSINQSIPASPVASLQSQSATKHSSTSTSSLSAGQDASLPSSQRSRNFSMESSSRSSTVYPAYQPPSSSGSTRPWVRDADASSVRSCGTASEGSGQEEQGETLSVMSPVAPPQIPFLASNSAPATGCKICVDASPSDHFVVVASLPGFSLDNITLALKRNGALHILADRYDQSCASSCPSLVSSSPSSANSGRGGSTGASSIASGQSSGSSACSTHSAAHFERLVELGEQAIGSKVTAEFDGKRLRMVVKKRNPGPRSGFKSSCSTRSGTSDSGHASNSRSHVGSSAFSIF